MKLITPFSAVAALSLLGACSQISPASEPAVVAPAPAMQPADATAPEPAVAAAEAETEATTPTPVPTAGQRLGEVTASLGDPSVSGNWLATSLVSSAQPGRVEVASGQSADVELRPMQGAATLSLSAMQALGVGLADIPTVTVYTR